MISAKKASFSILAVPAIARIALRTPVRYLLQNFVFQGLVVGSGVDWASDEDTRQLVLSLGETLEFAA